MEHLVSKISGLFNSKPTRDGEATQRYLELTKKVVVRVHMLASPKFNFEQCTYLVEKLKMAVESAESFLAILNEGSLWFPSPGETTYFLEIFKLLYALAKEVEDFIQICCKNAWIQAAMTLTNVSERVSSTGFNLMLWTVVFCELKQLKVRRGFTQTQVDGLFKAEVERVKEKASLDKEEMLTNLHVVLLIQKSTSIEYQQAILLLERLSRSRKVPVGDSPGSPRLSKTESSTLKRMESLGKGSAATVYRAKWLEADVAQKTFYPEKISDFEKEVEILGGLSHPNIASLFCYAKDKRECSIVMELMDEDLLSLIRRRLQSDETREFPFGLLEAVDIMHQVGEGMGYLHGVKIVHRDLKSLNILVKCVRSSELEIEYVLAKVADFGLSRTKERSVTFSNQTLNTGTTRWMAPEGIKSCAAESQVEKSNGEATEAQYPFKHDIYSFAMVCYEILTGDMPFSSTSSLIDVKKMVLDGVRPPLPYECPSILKRLIERCWSPDAKERPRFTEICVELRYLKYLFLSPSVLRNVSPASNKPNSIPIGFKREAHSHWFHWTVGLAIGTTHSGFAYAKESHLQQMRVNYDYPHAESAKPYCKALTALYYNQAVPSKLQAGSGTILNCASWGHLAQLNHLANVHNGRPGYYVPNFKLLLPKALNNHPLEALPPPLTVSFLLADYLMHIGELALAAIQNQEDEGNFSRDSVQWCVTVPSTWNDDTKRRMKECMVKAGLVSGEGGMEAVKVVLKAEAASFHCHRPLQCFLSLDVKDKIMVVDIGGWTVDIVVQEVMGSGNDFKVRELTESSSGRCGGTSVDGSFMRFLFATIGCLKSYLRRDDPSYRIHQFRRWEEIKCALGHDVNSSTELYEIPLPDNLARKWEAHEKEHGHPGRYSYDKIKLTQKDLKSIFEPVVQDILRSIAPQLVRVQDIKVMFVVGGFAGSPYLIQSIRGCFSRKVEYIYYPFDTGSAVIQGAIALALALDGIMA